MGNLSVCLLYNSALKMSNVGGTVRLRIFILIWRERGRGEKGAGGREGREREEVQTLLMSEISHRRFVM